MNAGPAIGAAGAARLCPFRWKRPAKRQHGLRPQPGIVSPHDLAVHDALVARERAMGLASRPRHPRSSRQGHQRELRRHDFERGGGQPRHRLRRLSQDRRWTVPAAPTTSTSGAQATRRASMRRRARKFLKRVVRRKAGYKRVRRQTLSHQRRRHDCSCTRLPAEARETHSRGPTGWRQGHAHSRRERQPHRRPDAPRRGRPSKEQEIVDLPSGGKGAVIRDAQATSWGRSLFLALVRARSS